MLLNPKKGGSMRKVFTSLIVLLVGLAIAPTAAWANSIVLGSSNINRLHMAINRTGTGSSSWNEFQIQFTGSLLPGNITGNKGAWTSQGWDRLKSMLSS